MGANDTKTVVEKKERKYTPPPIKEKSLPIYDEEPKINDKVVEQNKTVSNGKETLVLDEAEKEETPLILDQEHKTEKIKKPQIKIASPSARKIAQDKSINLNQ